MNRRQWVEIGLFVAFVFVSNTVNATSVLMEYGRDGRDISLWEPFVWEYTSGLLTLSLVPAVLAIEARFPFTLKGWRRVLPLHLVATLPFSVLHVGGMVALRKLLYALAGRSYNFGNVPVEMVYEWRKDAFSYFLILFVVNAYRIYRERAEGEANYVESSAPVTAPHFRVTYNKRDFDLAADQVLWIEAAGNYVVLHTGDRTYLMRETMKGVEERLAGTAFVRAHRSTIVNLNQVQDSDSHNGRLTLELRNGHRVHVARSTRAEVERSLENHSSLRPSTSDP